MRVALIHDYLINSRGGERLFSYIADIYPEADIFTLMYDSARFPPGFKERKIQSSFAQKLPWVTKFDKLYFPLYGIAVEQYDLREYDLVISSSSAWSHGVLTQPETCHISYYLSTFRYAWHWYHTFIQSQKGAMRWPLMYLLSRIRMWDLAASSRVDYPAAISNNVSRRIRKYYGRDAEVIYPPVPVELFKLADRAEDFFLTVSALVPYKQIDVAIAAFTELDLPLFVIGEGSERRRLERMAGPSIRFLGALSDEEVRDYYSRCRAFVFTPEEDYGLTPLEAQASGRPVIAFGAGGALETIQDGLTGLFYNEQSSESLRETVVRFLPMEFDPLVIRAHAEQFDVKHFRKHFTDFVERKLIEHHK